MSFDIDTNILGQIGWVKYETSKALSGHWSKM